MGFVKAMPDLFSNQLANLIVAIVPSLEIEFPNGLRRSAFVFVPRGPERTMICFLFLLPRGRLSF
jgi:hypothetical protein